MRAREVVAVVVLAILSVVLFYACLSGFLAYAGEPMYP